MTPYICDTCGQSFAHSSTLAVHEGIHAGVKPYNCDTCGQSFARSGTLIQHGRTHTGVKPYTCDSCGKSFAQSGTLTRHVKTHVTPVRPVESHLRVLITHIHYTCDAFFSPFAAVSLYGVTGLAETFPFRTVSGPFLPDAPRFHVPPDRYLPPQLWSSSRALSLHLHFNNCSDVLGFVSSFDVAKPVQPPPSHNRRYLFHFRFLQDFLIPPVF